MLIDRPKVCRCLECKREWVMGTDNSDRPRVGQCLECEGGGEGEACVGEVGGVGVGGWDCLWRN